MARGSCPLFILDSQCKTGTVFKSIRKRHGDHGTANVRRGLQPNAHPSDEPELEDDAVLKLDPEVLAFMITAEVNAFYKSRGRGMVGRRPAGQRPPASGTRGVEAAGGQGAALARKVRCLRAFRDGAGIMPSFHFKQPM